MLVIEYGMSIDTRLVQPLKASFGMSVIPLLQSTTWPVVGPGSTQQLPVANPISARLASKKATSRSAPRCPMVESCDDIMPCVGWRVGALLRCQSDVGARSRRRVGANE